MAARSHSCSLSLRSSASPAPPPANMIPAAGTFAKADCTSGSRNLLTECGQERQIARTIPGSGRRRTAPETCAPHAKPLSTTSSVPAATPRERGAAQSNRPPHPPAVRKRFFNADHADSQENHPRQKRQQTVGAAAGSQRPSSAGPTLHPRHTGSVARWLPLYRSNPRKNQCPKRESSVPTPLPVARWRSLATWQPAPCRVLPPGPTSAVVKPGRFFPVPVRRAAGSIPPSEDRRGATKGVANCWQGLQDSEGGVTVSG